MDIYFSGGFHDNPLHQRRLKRWLQMIKAKGTPCFIAVEAHKLLFEVVEFRQREHFRRLAMQSELLGRMDCSLRKLLANAIAYEADTHDTVFPKYDNVIWLDDVRPSFEDICDPCSHAQTHLRICCDAIEDSGLDVDGDFREHQLLDAIDRKITAGGRPGKARSSNASKDPHERDRAWIKLLHTSIACNHKDSFGLVIVGEDHTRNEPDCLRYLLARDGHRCLVQTLREEPQQ